MSEKKYKPTRRKLRDARKQGEVVHSRELNSLAAFVALWICLWLGGSYWWRHLTHIVDRAIAAVGPSSGTTPGSWAWIDEVQGLWLDMLWILGPLFGVGVAAVVLVGGLQTRGMISFAPLVPKFERLNPAQRVRNLFSTRNVFELGKMLFKTAALLGVMFYCIRGSLDSLARTAYAPVSELLPIGAALIWRLMGGIAMVFALGAGLDYAHQFYEFMKKHKMSIEELRRDYRETDGDPHTKSRRRAVARDLLFSPVAGPQPAASVVIANPTHVSVALYYESGKTPLPRVVAKGLDAAALQIRGKAERDGVPVLEDPPLARKLYRQVAVGHYINDESIDAVAAVFRWVRLGQQRRQGLLQLAPGAAESNTAQHVSELDRVGPVELTAPSGALPVDDVPEHSGSSHLFPNLHR